MSIFADANEIVSDPYNESDTTKLHITAALTLAVMENTINKTFTRGLSDLFDAMMEPEQKGQKTLQAVLGSFVPNILNQTNGDQAFREVRTFADTLQSKTMLYNNVDPKRNVIGEIIKRPTEKYDPMGLFNIGNYREMDLVLDELSRVSMQDQSAFSSLSDGMFLPVEGEIEGQTQSLKDIPYQGGPQSIYDKVIELSGTVKIRGLTLREKLEETFSDPNYQNKYIDGKRGLGAKRTKGQVINKIITKYRNKAKSQIPEYRELYKQSIQSRKETGRNQLNENAKKMESSPFRAFNEVFSE